MYRSLLLILLLGCLISVQAQNLTGKWVGYFTTNTGLSYPYEINLQDDGNSNLAATTFTKFSGTSSAMALAKGIFSKQTKLASIIETKFDQVRLAPNTQACLMSNYLTYSNIKGKEILQGTYLSNSLSGSNDCGSGTVNLTKEISFSIAKKTNKVINNVLKKKDTAQIASAKILLKKDTVKLITPTPAPLNIVAVSAMNTASSPLIDTLKSTTPLANKSNATKAINKNNFTMIPWVLISRDNKLIKTINTNNPKISIDLYDNGSFESDSISVYDNNVLIFDRIKLSYREFHFELPFTENITKHELVLVAHITATNTRNSSILMYKDNKTKEEFIINTNNKSNAKIIIKYDPVVKSSE
jgi:hypothetical protein